MQNTIFEILACLSPILRPVKFMENYCIPQVFKGILTGNDGIKKAV